MHTTQLPHRHLKDLTTSFLEQVRAVCATRPLQVLEGWSSVAGEKWGRETKAVSFQGGVLSVKVANASLYSILVQYEAPRLLKALQDRFPESGVKKVKFSIG